MTGLFLLVFFAVPSLGGVVWIAAGEGTTTLASSSDGVAWSPIALSNSPFSLVGWGAAYSRAQQRWVAVGEGAVNTIAWSTDGLAWTGLGKSIFTNRGSGVAFSATLSRWIAVGSGSNQIAASDDGLTWRGVEAPFWTAGAHVAYSPRQLRWVAVGNGTNAIAYSTDGLSWNAIEGVFARGRGIAYSVALDQWLACGSFPVPGDTLAVSTDGKTWESVSSPLTTQAHGAAFNSSWLAVGSGTSNTFVMSVDGKTWVGLGEPSFTGTARGIAYNAVQDRWVAAGDGTLNTLATTTNLAGAWNNLGKTIFSSEGRFVASQPTTRISSSISVGAFDVVIDGDVLFDSSGTLIISGSGSLIVTGTATLAGTVQIVGSTSGNQVVVSASQVVGAFAQVSVTSGEDQSCSGGTFPSGSSSLSITLVCTSSGLHVGVIAGIAAGVLVALIVVAIVGALVHRKRSRASMARLQEKLLPEMQ